MFSYLALVSRLGNLDRGKEAAEAHERLKKVEPKISIAFIERSLPLTESVGRDRFMQGLIAAGMTQGL